MASSLNERKKRALDGPSLNDSRQKVREGFLVEWDQTDSEGRAILEEACRSLLSQRRDGELSVRGLVDAVNRETAGMFTKRGERREASQFVRERLGGTKAWVVNVLTSSEDLVVAGNWDSSTPTVKLEGRSSSPHHEPCDLARRIGDTLEGTCTFWDRRRGWGKILIRGTSKKVFAHWRDIISDSSSETAPSSLPRNARVTMVLAAAQQSSDNTKFVAQKIRIVDTREDRSMCDE